MKKKIKNFITRKKEASSVVGAPLTNFFTVFVVLLLATILFSCIMEVQRGIEVESLARETMLHIEADGYLNTAEKERLLNKLSDLGVENVSLTGTTTNKAGFGEIVKLKIKGTTKIKSFDVAELFNPKRKDRLSNVSIEKVSVAKN